MSWGEQHCSLFKKLNHMVIIVSLMMKCINLTKPHHKAYLEVTVVAIKTLDLKLILNVPDVSYNQLVLVPALHRQMFCHSPSQFIQTRKGHPLAILTLVCLCLTPKGTLCTWMRGL